MVKGYSNQKKNTANKGNYKIKLGIPKGSLEKATIDLFKKAGWRISVTSRNYFPSIDDSEISCAIVRAQEMSRYVESGIFDAGLTGIDWVLENGSDVQEIADLVYSKASTEKARWVLAVPKDSGIDRIEDCANKTISTELVNFTKKFFADRKIPVSVEFSWGATEAKVVEGIVDAIVEVTETGSTINAHGLKIIHTLLETNTKIIANKESVKDPVKREKIEQIAMLLKGALNADSIVGLKMNVQKKDLDEIVKILPSITAPTIAQLYNTDWFSVETVISEEIVREIVPRLIKCGADGIVEYPLNKVISQKDMVF